MDYAAFRERIRPIFDNLENQNSISYQLVEVTDLFQKISAVYRFASTHEDTSFRNSVIFQFVQAALEYGVCVPIRRLADGGQRNEISLYKLTNEIRVNCSQWDRLSFVTWDGSPYDPTELRRLHEIETDRILRENLESGASAAWIPIGTHEEIERRHNIFDLLSNKAAGEQRSPIDRWNPQFGKYLEDILNTGSADVTDFANKYLAHRIYFSPDKKPEFSVSLKKIESAICALWKCFNVINSVLYDSYMTPEIVHQYDALFKLEVPLVREELRATFLEGYENAKAAIEGDIDQFTRRWKSHYSGQA